MEADLDRNATPTMTTTADDASNIAAAAAILRDVDAERRIVDVCPVTTAYDLSDIERLGDLDASDVELRAYKLGKGKCSYNMVNVNMFDYESLHDQGTSLTVVDAVAPDVLEKEGAEGDYEALADGTLKYKLKCRRNDERGDPDKEVLLYVHLVYEHPLSTTESEAGEKEHTWRMVTRRMCKKGCKGRILRAIQRFGKLGKRCSESWNTIYERDHASSKNSRFLFISIDEACTHVTPPECDKKMRFRLIFSVEDGKSGKTIGVGVSQPIRVLANNDAPNGAAFIDMHIACGADGPAPPAPAREAQALEWVQKASRRCEHMNPKTPSPGGHEAKRRKRAAASNGGGVGVPGIKTKRTSANRTLAAASPSSPYYGDANGLDASKPDSPLSVLAGGIDHVRENMKTAMQGPVQHNAQQASAMMFHNMMAWQQLYAQTMMSTAYQQMLQQGNIKQTPPTPLPQTQETPAVLAVKQQPGVQTLGGIPLFPTANHKKFH